MGIVSDAMALTRAQDKAPGQKLSPFRSEKYRRFVASLPCIYCGAEDRSQAAHANSSLFGKGLGVKGTDAAIFPLCAYSPGGRGCHSQFDQGKGLKDFEPDAAIGLTICKGIIHGVLKVVTA